MARSELVLCENMYNGARMTESAPSQHPAAPSPSDSLDACLRKQSTCSPRSFCCKKHRRITSAFHQCPVFPFFVRHPVRESHFSGLTRQVGGVCVFHGFWRAKSSSINRTKQILENITHNSHPLGELGGEHDLHPHPPLTQLEAHGLEIMTPQPPRNVTFFAEGR